VGELHPRRAADLSLRDQVLLFEVSLEALRATLRAEGPRFKPLSPFQSVSRDLAPRVSVALPYAEVEAAVLAAKLPLIEAFRLVDLYTGPPLPEGTKSLTLSFTFRSAVHTLKEVEINAALDLIRDSLVTRCAAEFAA
jgi:phenylalanyl-tRNA synthetase beta chain